MKSEILQGDALSILKTMPDESVQCCITSPPYYGLRNYGTSPLVWDGEAGCVHEWGSAIPYTKADTRTREQKIASGAVVGSSISINNETTNATLGNFCSECGAWLGELGLEPTVQLYIAHLIQIFAEVKRVLRDDGTCWVNIGDTYNSSGANTSPRKSLLNVPGRFAIAMTDELHFIQRNEIIWHKPSAMPSSAKDRFTVDFEPIFFFTKSPKYKFNQQLEPVAESTIGRGSVTFGGKKGRDYEPTQGDPNFRNGSEQWGRTYNYADGGGSRNKRTTWRVSFEPQSDEHFASYPTKLVLPLILSGSDEGDTILDPFAGTGTTLLTAVRHRRNAIGIELQTKYVEIMKRRLAEIQVKLF